MHDVTLLCELSIMLRLACGAQKKGPELNALGPSVFGSFNFGCGDRVRLLANESSSQIVSVVLIGPH